MNADSVLAVVRALLDVILSLVPYEQAATELDAAARARANAVADAAEAAKGLK